MDDDSTTPPPEVSALSSPSDESLSSLTQSIEKWVLEGQPILNELLQSLHDSEIILEPLIETFIFSIVGGYTYHFSNSMMSGNSVTDSNAHSLSALMQNPKITALMEQFLQQKITSHIETVVE